MPQQDGDYPNLLEPYNMRGVELPNRIVMGGHGTRFVDLNTHQLTERQAHYIAERARGGTGLLIQGSATVHPTGLATAGVNEIWSDDSVPFYRMIADASHEYGTPIFGQLSHLGRQGNTFAPQRELWAPSAVPDPASRVVPHEMRQDEIRELIRSYRTATERFLRADYDGLEVYMAHGYLLGSFASRFSNQRTDEYGGSLANRLRLPLEVIDAVRDVAGWNVPIGIRLSAHEFVPNGITPDEAKMIVAQIVDNHEIDYVSVSQSNYASIENMIPDMSYERAPFVTFSEEIKQVCGSVPVMTVARLVSPEQCESVLASGQADFVTLVRPLIADPEFANKVAENRREELRECISCNVGCRGGPHRGLPVQCLVNPAVGYEDTHGFGRLGDASPAKRVLVIGAGPAGLKAAETLALRGHDVRVLEKAAQAGGQVLVAAAAMPYRDEFANSTRFLEGQLQRLGVPIDFGVEADASIISQIDPEVVVLATGSTPGIPDVPGLGVHVSHRTCLEVIKEIPSGVASAVVLDSGEADWKALTTAERLASSGIDTTLVTPVTVGAELDVFSKKPLIKRLVQLDVDFLEHSALKEVTSEGTLVLENHLRLRQESLDDIDLVVSAWYGVANDSLASSVSQAGYEVVLVGDCLAPRRAIDAIQDGFRIGCLV